MPDSTICITRPATAAIQHAFVAIMPRIVFTPGSPSGT